ncbi:PAP2 superfamily protein [Purpureocillium lavendulum]|uniref:PAP2 superfamily protein n=1 Tax=Purpureocillium lavendulum TaxID=1247861 RepID=A0AB34FN94_9HYPO|nr:PAP2 superfamily protein [Purpureocillium lavendulum]
MTDKIKYARVGDDASDYGQEYREPVQRQRGWIPLTSSFILGLVTMGAFMALYSAFLMPEPSHARQLPHARNGSDPETGLPLSWSHGDCGNSPEDAKERGCTYSIVLHSWLPKSCLTDADVEDAKDMYHGRQWPYETAAGRNLTMQELAAGDYGHFTTTFDWHVTHCMYVWKRLHRILMDPTQELDSYTANYHHTSHCVKMIGGHPDGMKDSGTKIFVKYPKCAK